MQNITQLPPIHPGEVLRVEFLFPLQLSAGELAKACFVPRTRIERIIREETSISTDTALRLAAFFATTPDFWINLQKDFDLSSGHEVDNKLAFKNLFFFGQ